MTIADYSLSDYAFDRMDEWRLTLERLASACNQTQPLAAFTSQLEEFTLVARSKRERERHRETQRERERERETETKRKTEKEREKRGRKRDRKSVV